MDGRNRVFAELRVERDPRAVWLVSEAIEDPTSEPAPGQSERLDSPAMGCCGGPTSARGEIAAVRRERACSAARVPLAAEGRADIHERVGPRRGTAGWHEAISGGLEHPRREFGSVTEQRPADDAPDVRVEGGDVMVEGNREHRASGVRPDPRQANELVHGVRDLTTVIVDDGDRGRP